MARRSWRSSLKNGRPLFFSPSPIRPSSEPSRARIGTISRKPLSTSQWRSVSGSLASGERESSRSTGSGSLALAIRAASDEEASSRRLRILGSASMPERGSKAISDTLSGWRARSDLAAEQVGEVRHAVGRADALDQQGERLAGVVLLAEEVAVDRVEQGPAVAQRPDPHRRRRAEQQQAGGRREDLVDRLIPVLERCRRPARTSGTTASAIAE